MRFGLCWHPMGRMEKVTSAKKNIGILHRAFYTTKEARHEAQPHVSPSGFVLTWDGRLDNREELIGQLTGRLSNKSADSEIVAAAYQRWGTDAFAKLIGDWALSVWDCEDQSLILAKDFIGTRHLYYSVESKQVTWCTILDPFVLFTEHQFKLEEEYIAGWLAFFPAPHLTPYVGIHSVPPSSFVRLARDRQEVSRYWTFNPARKIRYRTDTEYEEHFRIVFSQSVCRRLRSDAPILAELSGGMDSSSIVCMADMILSRAGAQAPRLDTLSYYDESEPNWNERPYFSKVEQKRGRTGCHIDASSDGDIESDFCGDLFVATPAHPNPFSNVMKRTAELMKSGGNRVVLCGVGGDEFTGGIPTCRPEIADLLVTGRLPTLTRQLALWALARRKPWLHLLFDAVQGFLPCALIRFPYEFQLATWLNSAFAKRQRFALRGYRSRIHVLGGLPSFQEGVATVDLVRRQLACQVLIPEHPYEERYPFLDRDLLEFLFSVPREQLVRPGQRRSLLRRALNGIVPDEILNRKRKAFVTRSFHMKISKRAAVLGDPEHQMLCCPLKLVDPERFRDALRRTSQGKEIKIVPIIRVLALELWLRKISEHLIIHNPSERSNPTRLSDQKSSGSVAQKQFS